MSSGGVLLGVPPAMAGITIGGEATAENPAELTPAKRAEQLVGAVRGERKADDDPKSQ
jgi:hypothetical protein